MNKHTMICIRETQWWAMQVRQWACLSLMDMEVIRSFHFIRIHTRDMTSAMDLYRHTLMTSKWMTCTEGTCLITTTTRCKARWTQLIKVRTTWCTAINEPNKPYWRYDQSLFCCVPVITFAILWAFLIAQSANYLVSIMLLYTEVILLLI